LSLPVGDVTGNRPGAQSVRERRIGAAAQAVRWEDWMGQQSGPLGTDVAVTHILVVTDPAASRDFWVNVLGAELYREYGGTSVVLKFAGTWLLLVSGGGPTADKPGVTFRPPGDPDQVSHAITLRVADCRGAYAALTTRGASFLTPPHDWGAEIRCFLRDPDGHLVEISESVPT
jgi:catechol 2,3-dioxygenase-like lactoylglutathione lyase family enzyme